MTYSVTLHKLLPDVIADFVRAQLDRVALAHNTFTDDALALIVRSSEGVLRAARNLCVASLLEAVRDRTKTVDLKQVNRVLLQPHWRRDLDSTFYAAHHVEKQEALRAQLYCPVGRFRFVRRVVNSQTCASCRLAQGVVVQR